jgi:hypothetical protein
MIEGKSSSETQIALGNILKAINFMYSKNKYKQSTHCFSLTGIKLTI